MTTQKSVPPAAPQPATENRWREAYERLRAYCYSQGWDVSMRHLAAPQTPAEPPFGSLAYKLDLLVSSMDEEIAERQRKKLRGSVAVLRAFRNQVAAIRDVAPTLSGSGESSSPSVGSSVAERTAKNAARYEWLREWHLGMYLPDGYVHGPGEPGADADQQAVLDTAIDAAMGSATEPRPLGAGR